MTAARLILLAVATAFQPVTVATQSSSTLSPSPPSIQSISSYWPPVIQRWNALIVIHAREHGLDPDLVAAVIQQESNGYTWAGSEAGAVGLMQVMPLPDRPPAGELVRPDVNIAWGTRILSHMIRRADGDLLTGLAAYIGGWNRAGHRLPRRQAALIVDAYIRAIAVRQGLSQDSVGDWIVLLECQADGRASRFNVIEAGSRAVSRPVATTDLAAVWPGSRGPVSTVVHSYQDDEGSGITRLWLIRPVLP